MKLFHSRRSKILLAFIGVLFAEHFLWGYALDLYDCDYGYVDMEGSLILKDYCSANPFYHGLAVVSLNSDYYGSSAVINSKGDVLFEIDSDVVSHFSEGLLAVKKRNSDGTIGLGGYLNVKGETAIGFQFGGENHYGLADFSEGLAAVYDPSSKAWGYIDATGDFVIAPQFVEAASFHEGRASVAKSWVKGVGYMRGYIDTKGAWISEAVPSSIPHEDFSEGLGLVHSTDSADYFIDRDGEIAIASDVLEPYWEVGHFHDGRAVVGLMSESAERILFGYLDASGRLAIDPQWEEAKDFSDGLAFVQKGNQEFFIDDEGNTVIDVSSYDLTYAFSEGLAGVCEIAEYSWERRCGFIDKTGALVIPMAFENIVTDYSVWPSSTGFFDGLTAVETVKPLWARVLYRVHALFTPPDFN